MSNTKKNNQKKRKVFEDNETECLLNIWASDKIQRQFHSTSRHNLIYESISRQLKGHGFFSTSEEVKSKIRNLKTEYRNKKPKSGSSTPDWKYFDIIHKVLGQRDAANDDLMDESLIDSDGNGDEVNPPSQLNDMAVMDDIAAVEETSVPSNKQPNHESLTPPVQKVANEPRIRKISRPPRRTNSREDKLIDTLLKTEQAFQKRLDTMEELEKRNENRDDLVATSMTRFLNAFAVLAENSAKQVTSSVSFGVPLINASENHHANTVACSSAKKVKRSSADRNDIKIVSDQQWDKRCGKSTSTAFAAASQSEDPHHRGIHDIDNNYSFARYDDDMNSPPPPPPPPGELEDFESFLEHLDDDMDSLPPFRRDGVEEEETSVDPVLEFVKSGMNSLTPNKYKADEKPRIISNERLQQPYVVKKSSENAGLNIFAKPSVATNVSVSCNSSKRMKPGSIIISEIK